LILNLPFSRNESCLLNSPVTLAYGFLCFSTVLSAPVLATAGRLPLSPATGVLVLSSLSNAFLALLALNRAVPNALTPYLDGISRSPGLILCFLSSRRFPGCPSLFPSPLFLFERSFIKPLPATGRPPSFFLLLVPGERLYQVPFSSRRSQPFYTQKYH